jgi:GH25 family lysozyme M1 (1,4-beta-N-acetylmuramidase)
MGGDSGSSVLEQNTNKFLGLLYAGNGVQSIGCTAENIFTLLNLELIPEIEPLVLDLSHHNGRITDVWKMKQRQTVAVFLKCTQGDYYIDDMFQGNWDILKGAQIPVSPYIFVDPTITAERHFEFFKSTFGTRISDMPVMLDCEFTGNQSPQKITSVIQTLAKLISEYTGRNPFIYTRASWWNTYVLPWSGWKNYPLMIARWGTDKAWYGNTDIYKPRDWNTYALWQFSADGNLKGSLYGVESKSIDLSRCYNIEAFIKEFINGEIPPPPPPPPPAEKFGKVLVTSLNIRDKPSITGRVIGSYPKNSMVAIYEEVKVGTDIWVRVDTTSRYCAMLYKGYKYITYV